VCVEFFINKNVGEYKPGFVIKISFNYFFNSNFNERKFIMKSVEICKNFKLFIMCLFLIITTGSIGCSSSDDGNSYEIVSGTWNLSENVISTDCENGTDTDNETYTITQDGNKIEVKHNDTGRIYNGNVKGSKVCWAGGYEEDGMNTCVIVHLTVSGDTLTGSGTWTKTDGLTSCSWTKQISGNLQI